MPAIQTTDQVESKRSAPGALRTFTPALIEQAKKAQGIPSNYRLKFVLGVSEVTMTSWTKGRASPHDAAAIRLAQMAGMDPSVVLAEISAERAQDDETRDLWRGIVVKLRNAGMAAIVGAICTFGAPPEAQAYEVTQTVDQSGLCVMSTKRRRRDRRRAPVGRRKADAPTQRKRSPKGLPALRLH